MRLPRWSFLMRLWYLRNSIYGMFARVSDLRNCRYYLKLWSILCVAEVGMTEKTAGTDYRKPHSFYMFRTRKEEGGNE